MNTVSIAQQASVDGADVSTIVTVSSDHISAVECEAIAREALQRAQGGDQKSLRVLPGVLKT